MINETGFVTKFMLVMIVLNLMLGLFAAFTNSSLAIGQQDASLVNIQTNMQSTTSSIGHSFDGFQKAINTTTTGFPIIGGLTDGLNIIGNFLWDVGLLILNVLYMLFVIALPALFIMMFIVIPNMLNGLGPLTFILDIVNFAVVMIMGFYALSLIKSFISMTPIGKLIGMI